MRLIFTNEIVPIMESFSEGEQVIIENVVCVQIYYMDVRIHFIEDGKVKLKDSVAKVSYEEDNDYFTFTLPDGRQFAEMVVDED